MTVSRVLDTTRGRPTRALHSTALGPRAQVRPGYMPACVMQQNLACPARGVGFCRVMNYENTTLARGICGAAPGYFFVYAIGPTASAASSAW